MAPDIAPRGQLLASRRRRFVALLAASVVFGALLGATHGCLRGGPRRTGAGAKPPPPLPAKEVSIAAVGDIMLDRGVWNRIRELGIHHVMAGVRDQLRAADITFANLECPLSTVQGHARPGGDLSFCADPGTAQALLDAGIDVVSLANNHSLDAGREGAWDTLRTLEADQIAYAGAYPQGGDRDPIAYLRVNDTIVAFLAYTDLSFEHGSMSKVDPDMQNALAEVREARNKADVVVVSYHWGEEYQVEPTERQKTLGHATIDAGADIILGHHPHVMSGVEQYRRGLILYSMGNFVFDQRDDPDGRMTSAIFHLQVRPQQRIDLMIIPLRIPSPEYAPRLAGQEQRNRILANLARMSGELGTRLRVEGQRASATFILGGEAATGTSPRTQPLPEAKGNTE